MTSAKPFLVTLHGNGDSQYLFWVPPVRADLDPAAISVAFDGFLKNWTDWVNLSETAGHDSFHHIFKTLLERHGQSGAWTEVTHDRCDDAHPDLCVREVDPCNPTVPDFFVSSRFHAFLLGQDPEEYELVCSLMHKKTTGQGYKVIQVGH